MRKIRKGKLGLIKTIIIIAIGVWPMVSMAKDTAIPAEPTIHTSPQKQTPTSKKDTSKEKAKIITYLLSAKEPKIKDALWSSDRVLAVGVFDDGSNRDGYAQYLCMILYDYELKGERIYIKVIDFSKVVQKKGFIKLGEAFCE